MRLCMNIGLCCGGCQTFRTLAVLFLNPAFLKRVRIRYTGTPIRVRISAGVKIRLAVSVRVRGEGWD